MQRLMTSYDELSNGLTSQWTLVQSQGVGGRAIHVTASISIRYVFKIYARYPFQKWRKLSPTIPDSLSHMVTIWVFS